ncbi:hypothetical protein CLV63_102195 [Murinocardiopsis flavida]|uniref:Uncharacterized protein n=1 Tax=Murinocardiopsis flavida TaxID=645275 RepID=A0A2P8DS70_9ACTN|nr:hypothetical protein [Murinocardiopsis flavida]PSL00069.1 hypothetical protein CLV63_102195 [Murinocardiopsis flavida]
MATGTSDRRQRPSDAKKFERTFTRICVGLVIAGPVLGLGAGALGAAELYPSDYMVPVALGVMLGLIGLGLLIAACAGLYVLGGWRAAPFGVVFVAGVGALVYGVAMADYGWRDGGVALLAISSASFWVAPALSPRAPAKGKKKAKRQPKGRAGERDGGSTAARKSAGAGGVFATGALIAVAAYIVDVWWLLLFGAMAAGTAAGAAIAMWLEGRRRGPAD